MTNGSQPVRPALPVPVITVRGTPEQCGADYGTAARDLILANLELYLRRFHDQVGLDRAAVRAAGDAFRDTTRRHHPRIAAMLDGVADGAGVGIAEVYALNARTELIRGRRFDGAVPGPEGAGPHLGPGIAGPDGADGACTSIGVLGTRTASGHLLLGQNWDWYPEQRDAMVLLASTDERDHQVVTLAEAGMLAKTGLNSAGVGICVNMLGCDRDGLPARGEPGVPYHVLLRAALEAESLSAALRAVCRGTRNSSINILLGQVAEAGGELIDVELVPGDLGWLHPVDGLLTHANHLESGLPVYDTIKDVGGSSLFRAARARRLLAPGLATGRLTAADLVAVFRDHASYPQSICRHVDEGDASLERSETVFCVLLDLDDRRLGIAAGPPCGHDFGWVTLAEATGARSGPAEPVGRW